MQRVVLAAVLADRECHVSPVGRRLKKCDCPHFAVRRRRWSKRKSHRPLGIPHVEGIDRIVRHPGKEDCLASRQAPEPARFDGDFPCKRQDGDGTGCGGGPQDGPGVGALGARPRLDCGIVELLQPAIGIRDRSPVDNVDHGSSRGRRRCRRNVSRGSHAHK